MSSPLLIARTLDNALYLLPAMANRHGLVTGATGTGKTVTLQKLAESFSASGVPVFMADVKGDLTGVAMAGQSSEKLQERLAKIGVTDWQPQSNPVVLWDIFGEKGHPVRATVSDLGPLLLARLLNLNEVQSGVLQIIFRIADDQGFLLLSFPLLFPPSSPYLLPVFSFPLSFLSFSPSSSSSFLPFSFSSFPFSFS